MIRRKIKIEKSVWNSWGNQSVGSLLQMYDTASKVHFQKKALSLSEGSIA
jgi:hypothetical protein